LGGLAALAGGLAGGGAPVGGLRCGCVLSAQSDSQTCGTVVCAILFRHGSVSTVCAIGATGEPARLA
jgi:hypothetical protein